MNNPNDVIKQVLVIRKDLKMRRGKEIAQGSHASMGTIFDTAEIEIRDGKAYLVVPLPENTKSWFEDKFTKICLCCESEAELLELHSKAQKAGLICSLILDAGLTEFGGKATYTALGIGPDLTSKINPITGHLKLY